jgi:hypothetical protein
LSPTETSKIAGEEWKALSEADKSIWKQKAIEFNE